LGLLFFAVAAFLLCSFVSFLTTGQVDQSLIEDLRQGELLNEDRKFANLCGSMGAYTAYFFMKQGFGLAAFIVPVFLFLLSVNLMKAYKANLLKWFLSLMVVMLWL
jgi:S-DNA-T family DNA segregation ATPase FtsK/SpoIIIE